VTPQRIQLRRTKGWRLREASIAINGLLAVKVDRSTRWGNPYDASLYGIELSLRLFRDTASGIWDPGNIPPGTPDETWRELYSAHQKWHAWMRGHPRDVIRRDLRGKNLCCWCKPGEPCHADVLLEIANSESSAPIGPSRIP
jgi:hypothetical protein